MSLGYIGRCKIISEDKFTVFYVYSGANWNNESQSKEDEFAFDGVLAIDKSVLKWEVSKPKKQTKYFDWANSALDNGEAVIITECRNEFKNNYIARKLFYNIFEHLYEKGMLPNSTAFIQ